MRHDASPLIAWKISAVIAVAVVAFGTPAWAKIIDDFTIASANTVPNDGLTTMSIGILNTLGNEAVAVATDGTGNHIIGGTRTTSGRWIAGGSSPVAQVFQAGDGFLAISNTTPDGNSLIDVQWSPSGANLVEGGANAFLLDYEAYDQAADVNVALTVDGDLVTKTIATTDAAAGVVEFAFADFGTANFTSIASIQLVIASPGIAWDIDFGTFETNPEPSSFALLGLVCVGLGLYHRHRKRSAATLEDDNDENLDSESTPASL